MRAGWFKLSVVHLATELIIFNLVLFNPDMSSYWNVYYFIVGLLRSRVRYSKPIQEDCHCYRHWCGLHRGEYYLHCFNNKIAIFIWNLLNFIMFHGDTIFKVNLFRVCCKNIASIILFFFLFPVYLDVRHIGCMFSYQSKERTKDWSSLKKFYEDIFVLYM